MFSDQIMTFLTIDLIYVALSVLKKEDVHVGEYFDILYWASPRNQTAISK